MNPLQYQLKNSSLCPTKVDWLCRARLRPCRKVAGLSPALAAALLAIESSFTLFQGSQPLLAPPHNHGKVYADSQEWLSYQNAKRIH